VTFEMKSGREHNTPDKAVWGFACTVRPQEVTSDDGSTSLPYIIDLSLSITSLSCCMIGQLFNGAAVSSCEQECEAMMMSPLLRRYAKSNMILIVYNNIQVCVGVNVGWPGSHATGYCKDGQIDH